MLGDHRATLRKTVRDYGSRRQIVVRRQRDRMLARHAKQFPERPRYPTRKWRIGRVSRDDKTVRRQQDGGVLNVDKLSSNCSDLAKQRLQSLYLSIECAQRGDDSTLTRNYSAGTGRQA